MSDHVEKITTSLNTLNNMIQQITHPSGEFSAYAKQLIGDIRGNLQKLSEGSSPNLEENIVKINGETFPLSSISRITGIAMAVSPEIGREGQPCFTIRFNDGGYVKIFAGGNDASHADALTKVREMLEAKWLEHTGQKVALDLNC